MYFDCTCFYSLLVIVSVYVIAPWTDIRLLAGGHFLVASKRLVEPFLIVQAGSNGRVLMTFQSF